MDYQKAIDNFYPVEIIDRDVKIEMDYIGEGLSGDYQKDDPDDMPLLRFTVFQKELTEITWKEVEEASYCTNVPVNTSRGHLVYMLENIMICIAEDIRNEKSIKKKCQEFSWLCEPE